jgi:hypothetical protein
MEAVARMERSEIRDSVAAGYSPRIALRSIRATGAYRTTPEVNPALRRGGLMSFFRKQCASLPA